MRRLLSTLALVAVLAGLGAYIYFVTWKKDDSAASKQEKAFAGLTADKVSELKVKAESGDVTSLKKDGDTWQMTAPIATRASDADLSNVTNALATLEVGKIIDENPTNLKEYGLDSPKVEVDYKSSDGKSGKLRLGEKTATGSNLYAQRNDEKRVFLIPQYQETAFNKSPFELRDKSIMTLQHDKIDGVEVDLGGKTLQFAKSGTEWKLVKPLAARADFAAVEGLLSHIETAQMKSVVNNDPTPADLKKYGLDKPAVTVNVQMGSSHATFLVGGQAEAGEAPKTDPGAGGPTNEGTSYAKDGSRPTVVTIDKSVADDLKKNVDDYRRHDVFEMRAFNATHVEITRGSQKLVLDLVKAQGANGSDIWKRVSPNPGDADKEKVNKALADLADVNVTSFVASAAKTGLDSPSMIVNAKFDDGKKDETITFGKNGSDVYVSRPDEPGAEKIDSSKYDDVVKEIDEISK